MFSSSQCLHRRNVKIFARTAQQLNPISIQVNFIIKSNFCSDDLVDLSVDYLVAYPALVGTGLCVAVLLLLAFAFFMREGEEPRQEEEEEQEEEAEQTEKKESKKDT